MFESGHGVARDFREAVAWYQKGADGGDPAAQFNLAAMYYNGRGVLRDYVETYKWLKLAAAGFEGSMPERRERALRSLRAVSMKMTRAQISQAEKAASKWRPTAP
jgi:hypothetical protein